MSELTVNLKSQESGISDGKLTATRTYIVDIAPGDITPGDIITSETARLAPGVPRYLDPFEFDSTMLATSIKAAMSQDDPTTYLVTVDYAQPSNDTTAAGENPLTQTPKYSYGGSGQTVPVLYDASPQPADWVEVDSGKWQGKSIVTSANELFDEQPQRNVTQGTLTITRNEATYDDLASEAMKNTTNSGNITIRNIIYPRNTLRLNNITAEGPNTTIVSNADGTTTTVTYWTITYELEKNIKGWTLNVEDRGYHQLTIDPTDPETDYILQRKRPQKIVLTDGTYPTQPYPLDGAGKPRPDVTDPPAVLSFQLDPITDWSALNFA